MGLFLYKLSILTYYLAIKVASLFNEKAKLFLKGRKNLLDHIKNKMSHNTSPVAWFHCASLGEFEQGRPVIEQFKEEYPDYKIVLTFFSPSGYEIRKNYQHADFIFYLPLDTQRNARRFVSYINPSVAFFVKYEFWHFYVSELSKKNIPVASFSTIFRKQQIFFRSFGSFHKKILQRFDHFFVQDINSAELLKSINITNVDVCGDTRFDRVWAICERRKELKDVHQFVNGSPTMVIGSAWPEDISILTSFINDSNLKFIIAPHEIEEKFMKSIERDLMKKTIRYSRLSENGAESHDVLIIDNIGMLSSLYSYGSYAYVGGAFGKGLHNILEPATFGLPIFFGNKNYMKFREALDLIKLGGAASVASYDELRVQFRAFADDRTYEIASQINRDYVKNNIGATEKIINYTSTILH